VTRYIKPKTKIAIQSTGRFTRLAELACEPLPYSSVLVCRDRSPLRRLRPQPPARTSARPQATALIAQTRSKKFARRFHRIRRHLGLRSTPGASNLGRDDRRRRAGRYPLAEILKFPGRELGTRTASSRALHDGELTAAHKTLPFRSRVRITNHANGRSIVVTITDRGPYVRGRVIDVSAAGARALGFSGLTRVSVEKVGTGS